MKTLMIIAVVIMFIAFAINGILYTYDNQDPTHFYE